MRLNDVWKKANEQIGFYTKDNFENIPSLPGVYAWFYPLRITSDKLSDFLKQVSFILNYDAVNAGLPSRTNEVIYNWEKLIIKIETANLDADYSRYENTWKKLCTTENFDTFRKIILKSSIFLPPLYVGKTTNLNIRSFQHINGTAGNSFHSRFETHAEKNDYVSAKSVKDLLLVTLTTEEIICDEDTEGLIEFLLKIFSKPKYSII